MLLLPAMHLWRILAQRLERIEHGRQRLVLDHDALGRLGGDLLADRGDRRDAVAGMAHELVGEHRLVLEASGRTS